MSNPLRRITVVGASLAGLRAVEVLRREGFDGELTLIGAEPHLPYDRPPLSKQLLTGEWEESRVLLREPEYYAGMDVALRLGQPATGLDLKVRTVRLADGSQQPFDGLVIATGATPRLLPGTTEGPPLPGLLTLRTLDDCRALATYLVRPGARVVVVGAGFIGLEVAAAARRRGAHATVLEALPSPLALTLGEQAGAACTALHAAHGVELMCGVRVASVEGEGRVEGVRLDDGRIVPADVVVVGIGVRPDTGWLEGSGLALDNGVLCDDRCFAETDVVAAGDVARWHDTRTGRRVRVEHWTNAAEQGAHAAANLLAGPASATAYAPIPYVWSDQYDRRLQFAGQTEPGDEARTIGSVTASQFVTVYGRAGGLTAVLGLGMVKEFLRCRRLLNAGASMSDATAELERAAPVA